ncbi:hypothetical protein BHM03_00062816 [Ensete ventricosum]|nr:hypothetical protein BHM03_00062816 [Ensete ventricosum]
MKVKKSVRHVTGRPAPSPPPKALVKVLRECSTHGEKHPGGGGSELSRKKTKVVVSKHLKKVEGISEQDCHNKGKESAESIEPPSHPFSLRDLCEKISQSQVQASGRSEDDAVGNSPRMRRELVEGIRSLPGWRKGVHRKKTKTHRKIVKGSLKACR